MTPRTHRFRLRRAPRLPVLAVAPALLALLALLATGACGGSGAPSSPGDRLTVVTTVAPLAWLAGQLGHNHVAVSDLAGGADPHHVELTPRQIVQVEEADLVLYLEGLQPSMDEAVSAHASDHAFDATSVVDMMSATGHHHGRTHEQEHEHDTTAQERTDASDKGAHGAYDPHFWLDPQRFAKAADGLADQLAQRDPAHAESYRRQARELTGKLENLDEQYTATLSDCKSDLLVTNHQAFGYLAARYDLRQVGIRETLDADSQPSPARLAQVARLAEAENVDFVFYDKTSSKDLATAVANEIGADTAGLDPIARRPETGSLNYFSAMHANLDTLQRALGCS